MCYYEKDKKKSHETLFNNWNIHNKIYSVSCRYDASLNSLRIPNHVVTSLSLHNQIHIKSIKSSEQKVRSNFQNKFAIYFFLQMSNKILVLEISLSLASFPATSIRRSEFSTSFSFTTLGITKDKYVTHVYVSLYVDYETWCPLFYVKLERKP